MSNHLKTFLQVYKAKQSVEAELTNFAFGSPITTGVQAIETDKYLSDRQLASFTTAGGIIKNYQMPGISRMSIEPKEISARLVAGAESLFNVGAGQSKYSAQNYNFDELIVSQLDEYLIGRKEKMSAEILTTGRYLDQDGEEVYNFNRNANVSEAAVNLAQENPLIKIADLIKVMYTEHRAPMTNYVAIFGGIAYSKFIGNAQVRETLNNYNVFAMQPTNTQAGKHLERVGVIPLQNGSRIEMYIYNRSYKKEDGTIASIFPSDYISIFSKNTERSQLYGGLNVVQNGELVAVNDQADVYFTYTDPATRLKFHQAISKPLMLAKEINHFGTMQIA